MGAFSVLHIVTFGPKKSIHAENKTFYKCVYLLVKVM